MPARSQEKHPLIRCHALCVQKWTRAKLSSAYNGADDVWAPSVGNKQRGSGIADPRAPNLYIRAVVRSVGATFGSLQRSLFGAFVNFVGRALRGSNPPKKGPGRRRAHHSRATSAALSPLLVVLFLVGSAAGASFSTIACTDSCDDVTGGWYYSSGTVQL